MKIGGKKLSAPSNVVVPILRDDGNIYIQCKAVIDYSTFDELCPEPIPPTKVMAGGARVKNVEDPAFLKTVDHHSRLRYHWMLMESLSATPELEWEIVNPHVPDTWMKLPDELRASGFTQHEVGRIISGCVDANVMDEAKLEEARKAFTQQQAPEQNE